ncbi:MAG: heme-binding domain-containing protein [Bacteroidetes bacterium]|nr:heme-binding domain-containing protein [Bacteroidota bacterium]
MRKTARIVILGIAGIILGMQLFRPVRDNPPVRADIIAPPAVKALLRPACYDCHSNETRWPWYSHVNPAGWLLAGHVRDGRDALNFSDWDTLDVRKRYLLKRDILSSVEEESMPLPSYLLLHPDARLDSEDRAVIERWVTE